MLKIDSFTCRPVLAVLVVMASVTLLRAQTGAEQSAAGTPRVVVLPFTNISGQNADAWLGAGIAETVAGDLQRTGTLSVIAPEASGDADRYGGDRYGRTEGNAIAEGQALGADWVVTGSFQRVGEQLRITARVVDVASGAVQRTAKLDGGFDDLFALQDRVAGELGLLAVPETEGSPLARAEPASVPAAVAVPSTPARSDPIAVPARSDRNAAPELTTPASPSSQGPSYTDLVRQALDGRPEARASARTAPAPAVETSGTNRAEGVVLPGSGTPAPSGPGALALQGRGTVGSVTAATATAGPTVTVGRTDRGPSLDGRLDDRIWQNAVRITDFVQTEPVEGAPATEQTEVYIAYDDQRIYFAIYAHYSNTALIRANRVDRDQTGRDDTVSVWFDPFRDQQRAYIFSVNGYGVQGDSLLSGGGGSGNNQNWQGGGGPGDSSWDALFDSAGRLVEDGWTAEMAIPFKSLRYPAQAPGGHRWGFQIQRTIAGKDESVVWAPESRNVLGRLRQMGTLTGLEGLSTARNLELLPTVSAIRVENLNASTGGLVSDDVEEGGLNLKYGVTSNLTLDFTYNPDFSQIESDQPQIEVNQRFPLFFSELRPFFLEGQEIFSVSGPVTLLHTRTIVDPLFGAKLSGKVGKTTVGILVANDEGPGNLDDRTNPAFGQAAQAVVGRVRYDLYSQSHLGAILTDREFLDTHSRMAGVDGRFAIGQNHRFEFQTIATDHLDAAGAQRRGTLYNVGFRKQGRNLRYGFESFGIDPEFRNDLGFIRRTDTRESSAQLEYRFWPEAALISWGPQVNYSRNYDYDGVLQDEALGFRVSGQFARNITAYSVYNRSLERFGGIDFEKSSYTLFTQANPSRRFSIGGGYSLGDRVRYNLANPAASFLGRGLEYAIYSSVRPISRLQSQVNVRGSRLVTLDGGAELFDVKIFRALTTYQFTERLLLRNISEYNTFSKALGLNFLVTYRVNAGTVFYIGYDDHYRQENQIDPQLLTEAWRRTNRAVFAKFQYLFRY